VAPGGQVTGTATDRAGNTATVVVAGPSNDAACLLVPTLPWCGTSLSSWLGGLGL
jgi:hypothetical protein